MTNCIFYAMFFALFLNVSFGSLKYSQIHRTFMSMYKGLLEACTVTVDNYGDPIEPYFDTLMTTYHVLQFKNNISKYTKDYSLTYKFLTDNDKIVCKKECRRLRVTLTAKINGFYNYNNTQTFAIKDGDNL